MDGRKGLLYFLMLIVTLVLLLAMGELQARFFIKPQRIPEPPPFSKMDPYQPNLYMFTARPYVYFQIPGSKYIQARSYYQIDYEINSMGFRGPEILPKSSNDNKIKRLIVIGDSITEGHGNKFTETYSYRLGENIRQHGWEVVNMGVQGASPIYYAANLKRYNSVQPDAVLILIFENDLFEDRFSESVFFKFPILDDNDALLMTTASALLSKSRLYTLLRRGWQHLVHSPVDKIIAKNREITYTQEEQQAIEKFDKQSKLKYIVASTSSV